MQKYGEYHIGTSGLSDMSWSNYMNYRNNINSLEINSSFYRNFRKSTWIKWYEQTPANVSVSVKVWKMITHNKRLSKIKQEWEWFWEGAKEMKEKLAVVLFQFPPSFHNNNNRGDKDKLTNLERLAALKQFLPTNVKFAFEFRHTSWYVPEVLLLLEKNNWCLVNLYVDNSRKWMGDLPKEAAIMWPDYQTADFCYTRLHGSLGKFKGYYDLKKLKPIITYSQGENNFVYFNNSFYGERGRFCIVDQKKIYSCSYCNAQEFADMVNK